MSTTEHEPKKAKRRKSSKRLVTNASLEAKSRRDLGDALLPPLPSTSHNSKRTCGGEGQVLEPRRRKKKVKHTRTDETPSGTSGKSSGFKPESFGISGEGKPLEGSSKGMKKRMRRTKGINDSSRDNVATSQSSTDLTESLVVPSTVNVTPRACDNIGLDDGHPQNATSPRRLVDDPSQISRRFRTRKGFVKLDILFIHSSSGIELLAVT